MIGFYQKLLRKDHFIFKMTLDPNTLKFETLISGIINNINNNMYNAICIKQTLQTILDSVSFSGAFDQLKQNATKARIPFYGR